MFYFCLFLFFFKQWLCQRSTFFFHVRPLPHLTSRLTLSLRLFYLSLLGFWLPRIASLVNAHFMLRKHMKAKPHAWSIPATHGLDTVLVFSCSLYYCLVSHMHTQKVRKPKEQMKLLSAAPAPPPQLTVLPWSLLFLPPFFLHIFIAVLPSLFSFVVSTQLSFQLPPHFTQPPPSTVLFLYCRSLFNLNAGLQNINKITRGEPYNFLEKKIGKKSCFHSTTTFAFPCNNFYVLLQYFWFTSQ